MSEPIASVVRTAANPDQAKVLVALLQAEGVPAHVDGDALADEVAMSRRLMNLAGVRVMVPTHSIERAREILEHAAVEDDELERQALAAAESEVLPTPPSTKPMPVLWLLAGVFLVAGLIALISGITGTQ